MSICRVKSYLLLKNDMPILNTLAVCRLLNCENNAALFEVMKTRFGCEDGIELIADWLNENGVYFKREEK